MSALQRLRLVRVLLMAGALIGATAVAAAVFLVVPRYGIIAAGIALLAILWLLRGVFSRRRVVLWIEERVPSLRYSLAALVEAPHSPFRAELEARIRQSPFGRPMALAALRLVGIPVLLLVAVNFIVAPALARSARDAAIGGGSGPAFRDADSGADARFRATVTPPAYVRGSRQVIENPVSIAALIGSSVRVTGAFTASVVMPAEPTAIRLEGRAGSRLLALEPRLDSTPAVVLDLPERDTVIAAPTGALRLSAQARDDIGLSGGWFEIIVSSGSGELFTSRSTLLGRASFGAARAGRLSTVLRLDSLALKPGDVVHLRAVARDANPAGDPGSSETRTLRIPRPTEGDTVAIEAMPPPEVNRSELSQRMLIILTERLVARIRNISTETLRSESANIGREQARLRKRVGEIIFTRLTGEEHDHAEHAEAMDDTLSPGEALLRAASEATNPTDDHSHGDAPIVGVNRNLLEAFNAMWDAERRLGVGEPRQALPHMRAALDAIQRARAAERIYLRGRAPRIVLDVAKIRLTGKTDGIDPGTRSPRASALAATLARRARFDAAVDLLERAPAAAIDSLMLIRVDALGDSPAIAAALAAAIEDLRAGRDATASLVGAHRALTGAPVSAPGGRWSATSGGRR